MAKQNKQTSKPAVQAVQAVQTAHPIGKTQAGSVTYKATTAAEIAAAGRFTYSGTLACGTPVTIGHVVRRRYVVFNAKGVAIGYVTAANAVNAINRVNAATLATLRLH